MKTLRRTLGIAVVALLSVTLVAPELVSANPLGDEQAFLARLNELRAAHGVGPLTTRGDLADVARRWSQHMSAASGISHNPNLAAQAPPAWHKLGENVGMGMDVQGLHDAFVASPTHFRNMVDGAFEAVGIGVVHDAAGTIFVTVDLMDTMQAAPAATAAAGGEPGPRKAVVCKRVRKHKVVCRKARPRRPTRSRVAARR